MGWDPYRTTHEKEIAPELSNTFPLRLVSSAAALPSLPLGGDGGKGKGRWRRSLPSLLFLLRAAVDGGSAGGFPFSFSLFRRQRLAREVPAAPPGSREPDVASPLHCGSGRRRRSGAAKASDSHPDMDPDAFQSKMSSLAFGNVMAAAARNYQKEVLAQQKAQPSTATNPEVDLDELMDDPELEKLHADRIAALKKDAEKREALKRKGHGEFREITEGDFLGEVTGSERVICHFYHREFYRCKIMDKHLKALAPRYVDTKFIKLDAENAPFFVAKLAVKTLPCIILFRKGIASDRLVGFQDLGSKDDFSTKTLENLLIRKGILDAQKEGKDDDDDDDGCSKSRTVRSSTIQDSDSD